VQKGEFSIPPHSRVHPRKITIGAQSAKDIRNVTKHFRITVCIDGKDMIKFFARL